MSLKTCESCGKAEWDLEPCPFCGSNEIEILQHIKTGSVTISCKCGGGMLKWEPESNFPMKRALAVQFWNKRHHNKPIQKDA